VSSFQLETIQFFRSAVAVLMNITPDHLDRYARMEDYARAKARLFENQQAFDWAIVQREALVQLERLGVKIPSKVITFSATDQSGDFFLDRGLIISRMEQWSGPLLNMEDVRLRGPHNAENIMAALAVGRVLRLPLDGMLEAIKGYAPAPHRCEVVAEIKGVTFVNDSKATNVDAVAKALLAVARGEDSREPNVWLLAGGKDKGFDYHDLGPLLSRRVKGAFLFGETAEKIRAAWSLFTPCSIVPTLLEAVPEAAKRAMPGDVVLLSPACSSFDQFRNYQHRGEAFRDAVNALKDSKGKGPGGGLIGPSSHRLEALLL
jgi:UDP-N-acetylmuramoylalanine--D-glutamate ligase